MCIAKAANQHDSRIDWRRRVHKHMEKKGLPDVAEAWMAWFKGENSCLRPGLELLADQYQLVVESASKSDSCQPTCSDRE